MKTETNFLPGGKHKTVCHKEKAIAKEGEQLPQTITRQAQKGRPTNGQARSRPGQEEGEGVVFFLQWLSPIVKKDGTKRPHLLLYQELDVDPCQTATAA